MFHPAWSHVQKVGWPSRIDATRTAKVIAGQLPAILVRHWTENRSTFAGVSLTPLRGCDCLNRGLLSLPANTIEKLGLEQNRDVITHLLITCCTEFSAPGLFPAVF